LEITEASPPSSAFFSIRKVVHPTSAAVQAASRPAELVKSLNPDIIVNATGSVPTLPPITGLHDLVDKDGTNVATVLKMIERLNEYPEDMTGKKVSIIGGGAVGLDVMEFFTVERCRSFYG